MRKRKDEEFPKCRIIFVFIFRVLLAETPKTFSASRLTGQFFFKWLLCVTVGLFFLSMRTAVAWKFGRFSVTEVPVGTFLTGHKTKKQKKYIYFFLIEWFETSSAICTFNFSQARPK
jgi:hypothetical protein